MATKVKGRSHLYAVTLCREPRPEQGKLIDRDFGAWLASVLADPHERAKLDEPGEVWVNCSASDYE